MEPHYTPLSLFESLQTIQPSSDWQSQLFEELERINQSKQENKPQVRKLTAIFVLMISINVFSIAMLNFTPHKHQLQKHTNSFEEINSNFLISSH